MPLQAVTIRKSQQSSQRLKIERLEYRENEIDRALRVFQGTAKQLCVTRALVENIRWKSPDKSSK